MIQVLTSNRNDWLYIPSWMSNQESSLWIGKLHSKINWTQPLVRVYGKNYKVPRKTIFLASKDIIYSYSGLSHRGIGWPEWFLPLLNQVSSFCNVDFNGCLLNLYRDGKDTMGWHSDDEKEIDKNMSIASLSFGATRDFYFKNKYNNIKEKLILSNGDLLIMHSNCQKLWKHSLPKRNGIISTRINLTFRRYLVEN